MMSPKESNIMETLGGLFGGDKKTDGTNTSSSVMDSLSGLFGSGLGKELVSKLDGLKSLDTTEIQSILSALGQTTDTKVQAAKQDLQASQHDGEAFVSKLKGYITSLSQMLPTILPALQGILAKK